MGIKTFKYRLYPSRAQEKNLYRVLDCNRNLYNMVLAQRKYTYLMEKRSVKLAELEDLAKKYRQTFPYAQQMFSQSAQSIIARVDTAFQRFFAARKAGKKTGFPRFKGRHRFHSFEFKQYGSGAKLDGRRLRLFGIGRVPVRWHRPLEGTVKVVRIVHKAGQWFVHFVCEVPDKPELDKTGRFVGVDVGVASLITTSEGEKVDHPNFYRTAQSKLRILQRSLARKQKGSTNRRKALLQVQRQEAHVANQRRDFAHKLSYALVKHCDGIAVEELPITNLVRNRHLSKSILDAGWGIFKALLTNKAVDAGRELVLVDPVNTSKSCSQCGAIFEALTLADRWVECGCGLSLDRDHNAAVNILNRVGWDASMCPNVTPLFASLKRANKRKRGSEATRL